MQRQNPSPIPNPPAAGSQPAGQPATQPTAKELQEAEDKRKAQEKATRDALDFANTYRAAYQAGHLKVKWKKIGEPDSAQQGPQLAAGTELITTLPPMENGIYMFDPQAPETTPSFAIVVNNGVVSSMPPPIKSGETFWQNRETYFKHCSLIMGFIAEKGNSNVELEFTWTPGGRLDPNDKFQEIITNMRVAEMHGLTISFGANAQKTFLESEVLSLEQIDYLKNRQRHLAMNQAHQKAVFNGGNRYTLHTHAAELKKEERLAPLDYSAPVNQAAANVALTDMLKKPDGTNPANEAERLAAITKQIDALQKRADQLKTMVDIEAANLATTKNHLESGFSDDPTTKDTYLVHTQDGQYHTWLNKKIADWTGFSFLKRTLIESPLATLNKIESVNKDSQAEREKFFEEASKEQNDLEARIGILERKAQQMTMEVSTTPGPNVSTGDRIQAIATKLTALATLKTAKLDSSRLKLEEAKRANTWIPQHIEGVREVVSGENPERPISGPRRGVL